MKKLLFVLLFSFVFVHLGYSQDANETKFVNKLSGVVVLTGEGGVTMGQTDYADYKINFLGKGSIEYFIPTDRRVNFGLKLYGGIGNFGGTSNWIKPTEFKTSFKLIGGALSATFPWGEKFYPYLALGVSHMWTDPMDKNNDLNIVPGFKIMTWNPEIGFRLFVSDNVSVNVVGGLIAGFSDDGNEDKLDGIKTGTAKDLVYTGTIGLSYYIGMEKDADNDGVVDSKDMCPETPMGVMVDEFGCPIDSDKDGVSDYLDKCPGTPVGVKVDSKGCPLDSDNDGVADYLDKCLNTPAGVSVDNNGCPIDSDNDGVADYLDKCPNTPAGVKVDAKGCPLDSDGDGVPDYMDKCPNTPKGREVDADGCTVKKVVQAEVMSSDALFDFNKSTLKPKAYDKLNSIAETLTNNMDYTAKIEGYTDDIGSDEYNLKLSEKRAQVVADYLISKGINKTRLEIIPRGESDPVASNKTVAGRAANRRVEIKISQ